MNMYGTFLIFGTSRAPEVHMLGEMALAHFNDASRIAANCRDPEQALTLVYAQTFGAGTEVAIPAWRPHALEFVVLNYKGAHAERVIELAKHLACGVPYGPQEKPWPRDKGGADGGQKAPIDPVKPKPTRPRGSANVSPSEARAEREIRQIEAAQV